MLTQDLYSDQQRESGALSVFKSRPVDNSAIEAVSRCCNLAAATVQFARRSGAIPR